MSDPLKDAREAKEAILASTGHQPATILVGIGTIKVIAPLLYNEITAECPSAQSVLITIDGWEVYESY